ncbi:MAG: twin-arginine translocase TatA/TatE family subunit [Archaeoglobaceae archaeon]
MIGWGEFFLILILALVILGPDKLTDFARALGKLYAEYKKAKRMVELEVIYGVKPLSDEVVEREIERKREEIMRDLESALESGLRSDR